MAADHIIPLAWRPGVFRVGSATRHGVWYTVTLSRLGRASCNCPGFGWWRQCRHTTEVLTMAEETGLVTIDREALMPVPVTRPVTLYPSSDQFKAIVQIANSIPMAAGHAVPKGMTPGQAFASMLAGWEVGVGPMTALRHINAINGRTEPDAQLMLGICMANDPTFDLRWLTVSSEEARCEVWRRGEHRGEFRYTIEDADRAHQTERPTRGVWEGPPDDRRKVRDEEFDGPWQTHTALMLAYNAIKQACKLAAPDLINRVAGAFGPVSEAVLMGGLEGDDDDWDDVGELDGSTELRGAAPRRGRGQTPRQTPAAPPRGGFNLNALQEEIKAELSKQKVAGAALVAHIGGSTAGVFARWMNDHPGSTVESIIREAGAKAAGVDSETGEVIDGEATVVE